MSIFRTIAMFIYLFGYMIVHYGVLRRAERALTAGDTQLVEELVNKHIIFGKKKCHKRQKVNVL